MTVLSKFLWKANCYSKSTHQILKPLSAAWFLELLVIWCGFTIFLSLCSSLSVTGDLTKIQTYFVLHCSPSLPASSPYCIAIHGSCCDLCNYLILPSGFHLTLERLDLKTRAVCHSVPLLIRSKAWDILSAIILTGLHLSPPLKLSSAISYFRKPKGYKHFFQQPHNI